MKWNTYLFPVNGVRAASKISLRRSDAGIPYAYAGTVRVSGYLEGSGQADLTTKQLALEAALKTPGDLTLLQDSGAPSATRLTNTNAISGVMVIDGPDFPGDTGGEYGNYRKFEFTVWGEFPIAGVNTHVVLSFNETLVRMGGGPFRVSKRSPNANAPQIQTVFREGQVEYKLTQSGQAVGYLRYPAFPPPLFPGNLEDSPVLRHMSPHRNGQGYEKWGIAWEYKFIANGDVLQAFPNIWTTP